MRIAFLSIGRYPKAFARAGGDVRMWQDLASLVRIGHEVILVAIDPDAEIEPAVVALASSVTTIRSRSLARWTPRWLLTRAFNPETLLMRLPDLGGQRTEVARALDRIVRISCGPKSSSPRCSYRSACRTW